MTFLRTLDRFFFKVEFGLLVLFLGSMVLLAFAQVVMRNVLGSGFIWADTIVRHLVLWVGFTGAALAAGEERHISIDAFTKFLPTRLQHATKAITSMFAVIVAYFLADAALTFLLDEKASGSELVLSIPTWVALLIIPTGYALLAFHFGVKVIEHAIKAAGRSTEAKR
jgi:TRAP-type C4-dicarboxylate transport system permease small subunit